MFIRTALLAVVILAAQLTLHAQNLVRNAGFTEFGQRIGDGSIPPNQVAPWTAAARTPQIVTGTGCRDANYISMWGNKAVGEAITQPVALRKGVTYDVEICAQNRESNIPYAHVELRASTIPLSNPSCAVGTCEVMGVAKNLTTAAWTTFRFPFTPQRDYAYLTINTTNDIAVDDGAQVSWAGIDNVGITARGEGGNLAPLLNENAKNKIDGQYMIVFKPGTSRQTIANAEEAIGRLGGRVMFRYISFAGIAVRVPPTNAQALRALPGAAWIEVDQQVFLSTIQTGPPTGLNRIDRRLLPLDNWFTYTEEGVGVHAYVIDTGIRSAHAEFTGRMGNGFDAIGDGFGTEDCASQGHGTHVAGTIGGTTYGVAKKVTLHPVRVFPCNAPGSWAYVTAGVDWVTLNAPAFRSVTNMSLGGGISPTTDLAINSSIAANITYVVAAGNNNGQDACTFSPAHVPGAITVGATDPATDVRANFSNIGTCVDLFAPGVGILSAWSTNNTATNTINGTSMASPHVAGVAALYLQTHLSANPATVWNAILNAADVSATPGWPGIGNPGAGSPNVLLHWGSLNDGYTDGEPHITTVDGTRYDFQSAGEFVLLRDGASEIQTRQSPVPTTFNPGTNAHTGLASCVSINSAIAARVGTHRVTYQPNPTGPIDPAGLQLRVDGALIALGPQGLDLTGGGRITRPPVGDGVEIHFPDDTILFVTPGFWGPVGWYLNVHVAGTRATVGIMGVIAPGSWLPALPDGSSLGPIPASLPLRYVDLNQRFADAWRVTQATSLFDYAPGTSTATFTLRSWPPERPPCTLPNVKPVTPAAPQVAQQACAAVIGAAKADCVFDVTVTGERGFAKTYLLSQQIRIGATATSVRDNRNPAAPGVPPSFTATVTTLAATGGTPAGFAEFSIDGVNAGELLRLDASGRVSWKPANLPPGNHTIAAAYVPDFRSVFLPSRSADVAFDLLSCPVTQ